MQPVKYFIDQKFKKDKKVSFCCLQYFLKGLQMHNFDRVFPLKLLRMR
jgi:hypothetical protein